MNHVQAMHFWTWFRKHSDLLLALAFMSTYEREYWLLEVETHLSAYRKKLSFALCCGPALTGSLVITVGRKANYSRMAGALVANAPRIPGWEVYGLQLTGLFNPAQCEPCIGLEGQWFMPPQRSGYSAHRELSNMYVNEKGQLEIRQ